MAPPPPIQSSSEAFQHRKHASTVESKGQVLNLSSSVAAAAAAAAAVVNAGSIEVRTRGEESASSGHSGELELKQSHTSPVHSKRSSSAETLRRLLVADHAESEGRVLSAGNEQTKKKKKMKQKQKNTTDVFLQRQDIREAETGNSSISKQQSNEVRKSSAKLPFWDTEVLPLLENLESTPYEEVDRLCESCAQLWVCLEKHGLLGRTGGVGGSKKRSTVLRTVFKLLDHKEPRLLLRVAKIIVAVSFGWFVVCSLDSFHPVSRCKSVGRTFLMSASFCLLLGRMRPMINSSELRL